MQWNAVQKRRFAPSQIRRRVFKHRLIYAVVGIAGLWCITMLFRKKGRQEA